jgi:hypothetical protein
MLVRIVVWPVWLDVWYSTVLYLYSLRLRYSQYSCPRESTYHNGTVKQRQGSGGLTDLSG